MEFGVELKKWRGRNALVQHQAASLLGVKLRTYQNWEQGTCEPEPLAMETIIRRMEDGKMTKDKLSGGPKGETDP